VVDNNDRRNFVKSHGRKVDDREASRQARHTRKAPGGLLDEHGNLKSSESKLPARRIQSAYNQHLMNKDNKKRDDGLSMPEIIKTPQPQQLPEARGAERWVSTKSAGRGARSHSNQRLYHSGPSSNQIVQAFL